MSTVYRMSSILTKFEHKNNNEKMQKNEKPWTLDYTLVLQTLSSPLSLFFLVHTNYFSLQNDGM
jgi:hypothetical protein